MKLDDLSKKTKISFSQNTPSPTQATHTPRGLVCVLFLSANEMYFTPNQNRHGDNTILYISYVGIPFQCHVMEASNPLLMVCFPTQVRGSAQAHLMLRGGSGSSTGDRTSGLNSSPQYQNRTNQFKSKLSVNCMLVSTEYLLLAWPFWRVLQDQVEIFLLDCSQHSS